MQLLKPNWITYALLAAVLAAGTEASAAQSAAGADSGVFAIRSNGSAIGSERFTIRQTDSGWEATGELQLQVPGAPKTSETSTLRMDAAWKPTYYERRQQAPKKGTLTAEFKADGTHLASKTAAGEQEQVFMLSKDDLVVLDTNFFHQYGVLLRQFNLSRSGTQTFNVFVPQEATPSIIRVTLVGQETLPVGGTPTAMRHFRASTEDIQLDIWATEQWEIQRIEIPQANLEIVRQP